ncbi:MAG: PAS domain S-box protein [Pseudomonadota bacterium]
MGSNLRALVFCRFPEHRIKVEHELERGFPDVQVRQAEDDQEFGSALESGGFDVVITCGQPGRMGGLTVMRKVKKMYPFCPVIMLVRPENVELAVEAMKAGLDDFILLSPEPFERIAPSVKSSLARAQNSEKRKQNAAHYRMLAEHVPDIVWTMDMNLRFTYVNASFTRNLAYSADEFMAMNLDEILEPPSFRLAMDIFMEEMAAEETEEADPFRVRTADFDLVRKDGSVVRFENRMSFIRDKGGRPIGVIGVGREIPPREENESE